jgi:hypothetical protein
MEFSLEDIQQGCIKSRNFYPKGGQAVKSSVGTRCTPVHSSLYTGCIYGVLTPRDLKN